MGPDEGIFEQNFVPEGNRLTLRSIPQLPILFDINSLQERR